jgi:hypothetical protein
MIPPRQTAAGEGELCFGFVVAATTHLAAFSSDQDCRFSKNAVDISQYERISLLAGLESCFDGAKVASAIVFASLKTL